MSSAQPFVPHSLLPLELQRLLVMASQTEPGAPKGESFMRMIKVDLAITTVRAQCPHRFNHHHERK